MISDGNLPARGAHGDGQGADGVDSLHGWAKNSCWASGPQRSVQAIVHFRFPRVGSPALQLMPWSGAKVPPLITKAQCDEWLHPSVINAMCLTNTHSLNSHPAPEPKGPACNAPNRAQVSLWWSPSVTRACNPRKPGYCRAGMAPYLAKLACVRVLFRAILPA
jgi:hypothetical protein